MIIMGRFFKTFILTVAGLLAVPVLEAQNLDPTVEVTRAYIAGKMEVDKPAVNMAVPDSVLKFDMEIDYSVNVSPFKGSYRFTPYIVDVTPEADADRGKIFFLKAGAGYPLHPVFDFAVSPRFGKAPFTMSVYGTHRSYFGEYRPSSLPAFSGESRGYKGYCSLTDAGVNGRAGWGGGYFAFDLSYSGNAGRDTLRTRWFDAFKASARVASNRADDRYFLYDVKLDYLYGVDKIAASYSGLRLVEHDFSLNATLGPVLSSNSAILVDLGLDMADYSSALSSYSANVSIVPKYVYDKNRWNFILGVKLSFLSSGDNGEGEVAMHSNKGQYVYPALEAGFKAVRDYLGIYLNVDGGENINRYSSILGKNPYFSVLYRGNPLIDNTVERVRAALSLRGNVASRFSYDIRGGYACFNNLLLDSAFAGSGREALPAIGYADCNLWFLKASMKWRSQDVSADLSLDYRSTDILKRSRNVFAPETLTADARVVYNWRRRVFVGVHCNASLGRKGLFDVNGGASEPLLIEVPGYADLGLSAEYRFRGPVSVWVYGGNLLNADIRRNPFVCESGIWFNAGITLSL